jgi:hypothetical protein
MATGLESREFGDDGAICAVAIPATRAARVVSPIRVFIDLVPDKKEISIGSKTVVGLNRRLNISLDKGLKPAVG